MGIFAYIDESGDFERANARHWHFVAGFVTSMKHPELKTRLERVLRQQNENHEMRFELKHVHLAPLLHCEDRGFPQKPDVVEIRRFPADRRRALAEALRRELVEIADFFFCCRNERIEFDDAAPQVRYGDNLMIALSMASHYMQHRGVSRNESHIIMAPRAAMCLPSSARREQQKYHDELAGTFSELLGVHVQYNYKRPEGRAWADIACYYLRRYINGDISAFGDKPVEVVPLAEAMLGRYRPAYDTFTADLLRNNALAEAARWARDPRAWDLLCRTLETVDSDILKNQFEGLIAQIESRIDRRTIDSRALDEAMVLLRILERRIREETTARPERIPAWVKGWLAVIELLLACDNHLGGTENQAHFVALHESILRDFGSAIPSATERRECALELCNRAWNRELNNFEFLEVIDRFQHQVNNRRAEFDGEPDELTGKMCGTIGQAFAFLAHGDPEHAARAEDYLRASLMHFPRPEASPDTARYHDMAVNYLVNLHWQSGNLDAALEAFRLHSFLPVDGVALGTPVEALQCLQQHRATASSLPFDLLAVLRLFETCPDQELTIAGIILNSLWKPGIAEHPHQLIAKWRAWMYLRLGKPQRALEHLEKALAVAEQLDFAVQATVLPARGLAILAARATGQVDLEKQYTDALWARLADLETRSAPLAAFVASQGGHEAWQAHIDAGDLSAILRWMPFAYA